MAVKTLSKDTPPEVERALIEGYRRMSVADRIERVREMNLFLERLAMTDVRRRRPGSTEEEVRLYAASRRIPRALMRKAFGWDPDERGY